MTKLLYSMQKMLEGSRLVALTIKMCRPGIVSAYPITPQTHIVEDLAKFKADGLAGYEYILAESEFAAASIVLGGAIGGARVYTATSSQGLLLMTEVLFNIAGMRLPIVMTCANRSVSAPINIWNDQQDSVTLRDSGWIMQYCEDGQEAIDMHLQAYKVAEKVHLPVMLNMDGFVLTHTYENVDLPSSVQVDKFLPSYKLIKNFYVDPKNPRTFGYFATPETYMEQRQESFDDLAESKNFIVSVANEFTKKFKRQQFDNLVEYIGTGKEKVVLVAAGSVVGTMRYVQKLLPGKFGILKIKTFRPFPDEEVAKVLNRAKYVAVVDKSVSLGAEGIFAAEIRRALFDNNKAKVQSFIVGLGGKDVTIDVIKEIVHLVRLRDGSVKWVYPKE